METLNIYFKAQTENINRGTIEVRIHESNNIWNIDTHAASNVTEELETKTQIKSEH